MFFYAISNRLRIYLEPRRPGRPRPGGQAKLAELNICIEETAGPCPAGG